MDFFSYTPLEQVIQYLSQNTQAHICIHDLSGILNNEVFKLDFKNRTHSRPFCSAAKSTSKGLRLCLDCKKLANDKAVIQKQRFSGLCPNGLFEIAQPVCIEGKTVCIIYIGNIVRDSTEMKKRLEKSCRVTGISETLFLEQLDGVEVCTSIDKYLRMCDLVESYIRLLYLAFPPARFHENKKLHWAVDSLRDYIEHFYDQDISLHQLAKLYYINEKYIGRLFRKQLGYTFHEYLNEIRLTRAVYLLKTSDKSVTQIATEIGFNNIPYFNRIFLKKYGLSPTIYRKDYRNRVNQYDPR